MREDVHGDHRSCTIQHAILLRMANDVTSAGVSPSLAGRHRSHRREAILEAESADGFDEYPLEVIFPLVVAQIRALTGCVGFGARAPSQMQPVEGLEDKDFYARRLWIHRIAARPDNRRCRFVSTISQRLTITSGLSGDRRNATRTIVRDFLTGLPPVDHEDEE